MNRLDLNGNVLKTIEYKYDPVGRRILRNAYDHVNSNKSSTKKYYYDGDNILAELDANNNLTASYTHSPLRPDDILGAQFTSFATPAGAASEGHVLASSAGTVYYLKDHLNTVTDIINGNGQIVQRMDYSAFGVLRSVKDAAGNEVGFANAPVRTSFTYTGREFEPELGMYYYRARYYDPSTGRFLQQDPDPGKLASPNTFLSKYIYAGNAPTMFSDPSGKIFGIDDLIIWAVASVVIGSIDNNINGGNYLNSLIKGMVASAILYATWYATPESFIFDLANGISAQTANFAINVGSIALVSGGQSGNTFDNFTRNVMNGDSLFALGAQWMGYGFQVDKISGVGEIGAYLISATANFMTYIPTIERYCHPRESNGDFALDSNGKRVNKCK